MPKPTIMKRVLAEVVLHGGLPLRRRDVYRDVLSITGDHRAADHFAFSKPVVYLTPLSYEEFQNLTQR